MQRFSQWLFILLLTALIGANVIIYATNDVSPRDVKVPIILYHNIAENYNSDDGLINITPERLYEHFSALKNAGYHTITFDEYYNFVVNGGTLPVNPILITFDDGYLSNYQYAFAILKELDMKATIFIVTNTVGITEEIVNFPHFTWEQAKEMQDSGYIDIESHTDSHTVADALTKPEIQKELRLSKFLIETKLKKECRVLAYPLGKYTALSQELSSGANYKMQCILGNGYNTVNTPLNELRRITIGGYLSGEDLLQYITDNLNS